MTYHRHSTSEKQRLQRRARHCCGMQLLDLASVRHAELIEYSQNEQQLLRLLAQTNSKRNWLRRCAHYLGAQLIKIGRRMAMSNESTAPSTFVAISAHQDDSLSRMIRSSRQIR